MRLTRSTRTNLSPIFSLFSDPANAAWQALEPATAEAPWGEVADGDGTIHRLWRVTSPDAIAAVQATTRDAELLIADGHHRYETAATYADELGGEGEHRYMLMCLVALEDPGLTIFPTHRLVRGLDRARLQALRETLRRDFEIAEVPLDQLAPPPGTVPLQLGYIDAHHQQPYRLKLKDQAIADAALPGFSEAYRQPGHRSAGGATSQADTGPIRRGHLAFQRPVLRPQHRGGRGAGALRRVRRRLPDASNARRAGSRNCGQRREYAAQVDVLLPEATDRAAV